MSEEKRPGFYKDASGNWQVDRRKGGDRRNLTKASEEDHERRKFLRRQIDRELYQTDHKVMIDEALADFAEKHDGHL